MPGIFHLEDIKDICQICQICVASVISKISYALAIETSEISGATALQEGVYSHERERDFISDRILQSNRQTVILKVTRMVFIMSHLTFSAWSILENFCTVQCLHGILDTSLFF